MPSAKVTHPPAPSTPASSGAGAGGIPTGGGSLMPEPGQLPGAASAGGADDLISRLADQQIDQLMADEHVEEIPFDDDAGDGPSPEAAAELARSATEDLADTAEALSLAAAEDVQHDLEQAALLAPMPKGNEEPATGADDPVVQKAETAALLRDAAHSADDASTAGTDNAAPAPGERDTDTNADERPAPSFQPPRHAEFGSTGTDHDHSTGSAAAHAADHADKPDTQHSSAAAVARELAEDVRMSAARSPAADHAAPAPRRAAARQIPWLTKLADAVLAVPVAIVWAINLPARGLSDAAREVMGVAAIVTLVNAMALLLYLMLFA